MNTYLVIAICIIAVAVVMAVLRWVIRELYTPVPSAISQRWTFRLVFILFKLNRCLAWLLTLFRVFGKTLEENIAGFTDWWLPECVMDDEHVSTTLQTFTGVPVRIHSPKKPSKARALPAVVYFHGGGFVYGSSASFHPFTRRLCELLQCVVVSVDYRLAPVHVFPAALEDCLTATKWLLSNAEQINVDPLRVCVAGDSAGGQLAAAVAQQIHTDPLLPNLKLQALFYPALQLINLDTPSYQLYDAVFQTHGGMLTRYEAVTYLATYIYGLSPDRQTFIQWVCAGATVTQAYREQDPPTLQHCHDDVIPTELRLNEEMRRLRAKPRAKVAENLELWAKHGHVFQDPRISPLMADSVAGLPTIYIATGNYDCFRDDAIFYLRRLEKAGVSTHWVNYKDGFHAMLPIVFDFFEVSSKVEKDFVQFVRDFL